MKTFITSILLLCSAAAFAQNITNTLGVGGLFKIKDGASTFFTLTQSTGLVSLSKGLDLPVTTSSTTGVLIMGGVRYMHSYDPADTGTNLFLGLNAGNFTMSGAPPSGRYNTGVGYNSLYSNTTG